LAFVVGGVVVVAGGLVVVVAGGLVVVVGATVVAGGLDDTWDDLLPDDEHAERPPAKARPTAIPVIVTGRLRARIKISSRFSRATNRWVSGLFTGQPSQRIPWRACGAAGVGPDAP
jgi:hypothetical protein